MQDGAALEAFLRAGSAEERPTRRFTTLSGAELPRFLPGRDRLCFAQVGDDSMLPDRLSRLPLGQILSGGVFRNSLYIAPWIEYTAVRRLHISLAGSGRLALVVAQSAVNVPPSPVLSREVTLVEGTPTRIRLPSLDSYLANGRLYWDLRAISPDAKVDAVEFVTDQKPRAPVRMAILIRTFGRTHDVIRLLGGLAEQATTAEHRDFLAVTKFVVLDTSGKALAHYAELLGDATLNLAVMDGENLGGGGNAAQILYRVLNDPGSREIDEIVMTDDDLDITLESLCRYRSFASFRTKEVLSTCPVLMKSEPQVVWEDGGFWGRFHPTNMTHERASLFPRLLKHCWRLNNFDHLDDFGILTKPEYATFIFFAGPTSIFRKLGHPTAFFLRGDDIEYSLRAKSVGFEMISNPNVCAWHEPGHSYGQEFMAILHGIIVNLHYGVAARELLIRFFNGRLQAHGAIRDGLGLHVYVKVLEALVGPSPILQPGFDAMYRQTLQDFKALEADYEKLDRSIINDLLADKKRRVVLLPFLHMKVGDYEDVDLVILENHPQKTYSFRSMSDEKKDRVFYDALRRFIDLLDRFIENYDDIAAEMSRRLAATQSPQFWDPFFAGAEYELRSTLRRQDASMDLEEVPLPLRMPAIPKAEAKPNAKPHLLGALRKAVFDRSAGDVPAGDVPEGFDDDTYLWLNPDVAKASIPARTHYIRHGKSEGRAWRMERKL